MPVSPIPALPDALDGGEIEGVLAPRFEDITQEGRLTLLGIPHALGDLVWPAIVQNVDMDAVRVEGIVPILARMVIESGEGPVSGFERFRARGRWHSAAVRRPDGGIDRILLMMWAELRCPAGFTYAPPAPGAPEILAGRVFAEHVYTRPFAPPDQRRLAELPGGVPGGDWSWRRFSEVGGAAGEILGELPTAFGMMHTDPNLHVNSLVYPRLFEEVALALAPIRGSARRCEVMWRKPFFAGERATVRVWRTDNGLGGAFIDSSGAERCRIGMEW